MFRLLMAIAVMMFSCSSFAGNAATCILDKIPGIQNDSTAQATYKLCLEKNPDGLAGVEQGSGRGWMSFKSGAECASKKGASTPSLIGGRLIFAACNKLYEPPNPFDLLDDAAVGLQKK